MSEPADTATPRGTPLWVRILLGVSLAANLAVAGVILGAVLGGARGGDTAGRALGDVPFVHALDRADRRELARELRRSGALRPLQTRRARAERKDALLAALRADPFDRDMAEQVLMDQRAEGMARQDLGMRLLLGHLGRMSADERRAYADRLDGILSRGPLR